MPEITQSMYDALQKAITPISMGGGGGFVTAKHLQSFAQSIGPGGPFPQLDAYVVSNKLVDISRKGPITILNCLSSLQYGEDSFDEIVFLSQPTDSDIFILRQKNGGQNITLTFSAGVNIAGQQSDYRIGPDGGYIALQYNYLSGKLQKIFSSTDSSQLFTSELVTVASGVAAITQTEQSAKLVLIQSERTAATSATATWTVTNTGTNAVITPTYDDGVSGPVALGIASLVGSPTFASAAGSVASAINLLTSMHGFTALSDGVDTVTISANSAIGAGANGWLFYDTITGGATSTTSATFTGGVNGSDQADEITSITGMLEGQLVILHNIMPSHALTFNFGGNSGTIEADSTATILGDVATPGGPVTPKVISCCRKYSATLWVDPLGNSGNALRGWFNRPFPTIGDAISAAVAADHVKIMAPGDGSFYNEQGLFSSEAINIEFEPGAHNYYTGTTADAIFTDSGFDVYQNLFFPKTTVNYGLTTYSVYHNGSGASDKGVFLITRSNSQIVVIGGSFMGKDYAVKVNDGIAIFENCEFNVSASGAFCAIIAGGAAVFRNCTFNSPGSAAISRTAGSVTFENCLISSSYPDPSGHGIYDSSPATTGGIVFIGTNRIPTTHAGSKAIKCDNAQNYKVMGTVYSKRGFGGTTPTDLITGAAMVMVTDTDVE